MNEIEFINKKFKELINIKQKKIKDYGGFKNYRYGLQGWFFDIARKFGRLENFIFYNNAKHLKDLKINYETIEDTVIDLISYSFSLLYEINLEKKIGEKNENRNFKNHK